MSRLQASLDAISALTPPQTSAPWQQLIAAKCKGLMRGYEARWSKTRDEFSEVTVEEMISSDLWNPSSGRTSRSFRVAGKIDVRCVRLGRQAIIDHKTTSDDITDPNSAYWRQLVVESQLSHYNLLEWLNGRRIDEGIWDVVRKPSISPKKLSKKDLEQVVFTGQYFGAQVSEDSMRAITADPESRETAEMYESRLAHDCTEERPEWYFQRRTYPRLDSELAEYAQELWEHGQELLHVRQTNRHVRNSGACLKYGGACEFLGICSGHDDSNSENWRRKQNVHSELPLLNGDGRDVLTNSRVRTFQTCRRLHWLKYELGIERADADDREALYFGNIWHEAQAAWWAFDSQKEQGNVNDANDSAGSELATVCNAV